MKTIRLLGIAPYAGLADLLRRAGRAYPDLQLDVEAGDLDAGVKVALSRQRDYQAILSRGGTAQMIAQAVDIPVIPIELSGYDLLRAIRLAQDYQGRFAIAGFGDFIGAARLVCELLRCDAQLIHYESADEVAPRLAALKAEGCGLIVGDSITVAQAKALGLHGILITSGEDSVRKAVETAHQLCGRLLAGHRHTALLEAGLSALEDGLYLCDAQGKLLYANKSAADTGNIEQFALQSAAKGGMDKLARTQMGFTRLQGRSFEHDGELWTIVHAQAAAPQVTSLGTAVSVTNPSEGDFLSFEGLVGNSPGMKAALTRAQAAAATALPVWIEGERGSGKDTLALTLHAERTANRPMVTIHCAQLRPELWQGMIDHQSSLLHDVGMTIYLRDFDSLPLTLSRQVEDYIHQSRLYTRCRLLVSSCRPYRLLLEQGALSADADRIFAHHLHLPPLRERREDIPSLASLHLARLSTEYGRQRAGFQPGAMQRLQDYYWPQNLPQFHRILRELALLPGGPWIGEQEVALLLGAEDSVEATPLPVHGCERTLAEYEKELIQRVLVEENMNHTAAARRLGISRSTLWRKTKEFSS